MRIGLVTIPPIERTGLLESKHQTTHYIPLGILCLAAVAEKMGKEVEIIDLAGLTESKILKPTKYFYKEVSSYLAQKTLDVVGFTTMCSSYPISIKIAEEYKKTQRSAIIILGGVQATTTDYDTIKNFNSVDIIVRGEGETTFEQLIHHLDSERLENLNKIKGITYRKKSQIIRTPPQDLIQNIDYLPYPAYHLYPLIQNYEELIIEIGRSCPFACSFCATSVHWSRKSRFKTISRVLREIVYLLSKYKKNHFFFLHDCATVNREFLLGIAEKIKDKNLNISWRCHGKADHLEEGDLRFLRIGNFKEIFCGIESGSERIQAYIGKKLNLQKSLDFLREVRELNINCTTSFIIGFPEETEEDIEKTLTFALKSVLLGNNFALYTLVPLAGTPLFHTYREHLEYNEYIQEPIRAEMLDFDLIKRFKDLFPNYYYVSSNHLSREFLAAIELLLYFVYRFFPIFSTSWKYIEGRSFLELCKLWHTYCQKKRINFKKANIEVFNISPLDHLIYDFLQQLFILYKMNKLTHNILKYELAKVSLILNKSFDGTKSFRNRLYWLGAFDYKIKHIKTKIEKDKIDLESKQGTDYILIQKIQKKSLRILSLSKPLFQYVNILFKTGNFELASKVIKDKYLIEKNEIELGLHKIQSEGVIL